MSKIVVETIHGEKLIGEEVKSSDNPLGKVSLPLDKLGNGIWLKRINGKLSFIGSADIVAKRKATPFDRTEIDRVK